MDFEVHEHPTLAHSRASTMSAEQVGVLLRTRLCQGSWPSSPCYYPLSSEGAVRVTGWSRASFSCLEANETMLTVPRTGMGFPLLLAHPSSSRFGIIESFFSPETLGRVKEPVRV